MHPSHAVEKEYEAEVAVAPTAAAVERLCAGMLLDDGPTSPCRATIERRGSRVTVRLVIHEGRKRQVRRMLAAIGHPVLALHRVRVGDLRLADLPVGALRPLTPAERAAIAGSSPREG
jgi:pseudouridine synthase